MSPVRRRVGIKKIFALLLALFLSAGSAVSQPASKPLRVHVGLGTTIPVAPDGFRSDHNPGFNVMAGLGYTVNTYTEVIARLELHSVLLNSDEQFGSSIEFNGGGIDMLMFGADLKLSAQPDTVTARPFLTLGGGWSRLSQSAITTELAFEQYASLIWENQSRLYYSLAAGLDLRVSPGLTVFVMARYLNVLQDADNLVFIPVTAGVKF